MKHLFLFLITASAVVAAVRTPNTRVMRPVKPNPVQVEQAPPLTPTALPPSTVTTVILPGGIASLDGLTRDELIDVLRRMKNDAEVMLVLIPDSPLAKAKYDLLTNVLYMVEHSH